MHTFVAFFRELLFFNLVNTQISLPEAFSHSGLEAIDIIILLAYVIILISVSVFLSSGKEENKPTSANDYFLAGNTLTWWIVGASLIAANISTEQIVGMTGSGYRDGIALAAYEFIGAIVLLIVGKFLLPIMMERKIFTMPQFLRKRYNNTVGLTFSVLWIFLYIFVNLTSVAWLGALAIEQITGLYGMEISWLGITFSIRSAIIIALFLVAGLYSIHGGMETVAWTDVVQIIFIIAGGLTTTYFVIQAVAGDHASWTHGLENLFNFMLNRENEHDVHFHLIVQQSHNPKTFSYLPGMATVIGGLLLNHIAYWGFNQFITQKGLAANSIHEAQKGFLFAAFLKMLVPFIAILPGLCAYYLMMNADEYAMAQPGDIRVPDEAYPWLIRNFIPTGIKGLALVSLVAAILSSLASMVNSTATIFTLDIYRNIKRDASDPELVKTGRIASFVALIIAAISTAPMLGDFDQGFQYIQEYSSPIYTGLVIIFGLGLLWRRASTTASIWTAILTIPVGVAFKLALPTAPFPVRAGYAFIVLAVLFITISLSSRTAKQASAIGADQRRAMRKWGYILGGAAILSLLFATSISMGMMMLPLDATPETSIIAYFNDIGFQAFYFFGFFIGTCALALASNADNKFQDPKALPIHLDIFSTPRSYTIGSIIIGLLCLTVYIYLW